MAIDIATEKLIPCDELPSRFPDHVPGRNGNPVHHVTVEQWRRRGLHGLHLETLMVGGRRCTSLQALARFYAAVTEAADHRDAKPAPAPVPARSDRVRRRASSAAAKELVKRRA